MSDSTPTLERAAWAINACFNGLAIRKSGAPPLTQEEAEQLARAALDASGTDELVLALEPLANLFGPPAVNLNDPLSKWFTMANLQAAHDAIDRTQDAIRHD